MPKKFETKLKRDDEQLNRLGRKLLAQFTEIEKRRYTKELEWIDNLRRVKGVYDPSILSRIPEDASKVFIKYTRAKERYVRSKINSIIFPEGGKAWAIEPTPNPEPPKDILDQVSQQAIIIAQQRAQAANSNDFRQFLPSNAELERMVKAILKKRCSKLEKLIEDQLVESNYEDVLKKVIKSSIRYGTGVWKGPMVRKTKVTHYEYDENNKVVAKTKYEYSPYIKFVPIWNFYPDMSVTDPEDLTYVYELHCMTKADLIKLAKQRGFFSDIIYKYIEEHPDGDYTVKNWESHLMAIDDEENKTPSDDKPTIRAYQVLDYWGYIDGTYFKSAGVEGAEDLNDYEVYEARVWLLGDKVIKIALNPLPYGSHPYHIFYFEKDETSIFGEGLPTIIKATQDVVNATSRMILDNGAIAAGPQIEVNVDLLDDDQDVSSVYPRKIWYRTGLGIDGQYPAVRSVNIDSHITEYIQVLDVFRKLGDEESSLPSVLWTNLQTNETARGVLIRYKTAHITLMDIIKEFDTAMERFIRAMVKWNYKFFRDPSIIGDYKIKAKGTDTLLETETKLEAMVNFMQTITEQDEPYIDRLALLKERVKLFGLDAESILRTEEEAQEYIARQQAMAERQMAAELEMLAAKTNYEKAKAANMLAKSKKALTEDDLLKKQFVKEMLDGAKKDAEEYFAPSGAEAIAGSKAQGA